MLIPFISYSHTGLKVFKSITFSWDLPFNKIHLSLITVILNTSLSWVYECNSLPSSIKTYYIIELPLNTNIESLITIIRLALSFTVIVLYRDRSCLFKI
jgi:hypothetical protein